MSEALRFNEGKPKLAYMLEFPSAIEAVSRIMEFGATKYEDGNWKIGGKPDREYLDSMMRHLRAWLEGEVYDQDSGCSHLGHAIWNLLALQQLNHKDEVIDEDLFSKRCNSWKKKSTGQSEMDSAQGCHKRVVVDSPISNEVLHEMQREVQKHVEKEMRIGCCGGCNESR